MKIASTYMVLGLAIGVVLQRVSSGQSLLGIPPQVPQKPHHSVSQRGTRRTRHCTSDFECQDAMGPDHKCWFGDCIPWAQANALY